MENTGFNTIRFILCGSFVVWEEEHDGYLKRIDRYLDLCTKHNIKALVVIENDCVVPKDEYNKPKLGYQHVDWGYHGGTKITPFKSHDTGYHELDDPVIAQKRLKWISEIIDLHKNDPRIIIWDLYNEPGNSGRNDITTPHLKKIFDIAREINPIQPLTSCVWGINPRTGEMTNCEKTALENSDIVSYHNYDNYESNIRWIKLLKKYGRPLINTEWLCRMRHNTVFELFPLFYLEKIGCYNWGFVAGKYQGYEPWEGLWDQYYEGKADDLDFTKWFHDLYRPGGHPYDPREIELIKRFCNYADKDK
jgi:hypothetical protein